MSRLTALISVLLACALTAAQAQAPVDGSVDGRRNQKIQRIVLEDAGNRIEELRYGGQTQSITVQPRGDMPAYEVEPANLSRSRPADQREGLSGAGGLRSWNVLRF